MANRVILGKSTTNDTDYGLYVSKPGEDVLDQNVGSGNLAFDSSDFSLGTLRIITQGSFSITCTKQNFGKKGQREVLSDEQNRANSEYAQLYPWDLDNLGESGTVSDVSEQVQHKFSSRRKRKEAIEDLRDNFFGSGAYGLSGGMGTITSPEVLANVYCDFGTKTLEFDPPLAGVKTPYIAVYFALANSTNHFHPWYANVVCTTGAEDYEWSYAVDSTGAPQSQQCVHMDSTWFRGKWSFRERVDTPLNQDILNASMALNNEESGIGDDEDVTMSLNPGQIKINEDSSDSDFTINPAATSGVWGGAFKCFAGLQGLAYYANNTHLTVDGFMSPTHTPTPFKRSTDYDADNVDIYNMTEAQHQRGSSVESPGYEQTKKLDDWTVDLDDSKSLPEGTESDGDGSWWHKDPLFHTRFANTMLGEHQVDHLNIEYMDGSKTKTKLYKEGSVARNVLGTDWDDWMVTAHEAKQSTYMWATWLGVNPKQWLREVKYKLNKQNVPVADNPGKNSQAYLKLAQAYKKMAQRSILKSFGPHLQRTDQDRFLHTHTLQGQPTGLDSFWNSFSNNMSQYVNANTPYGEMQYSVGQYGIVWDHAGTPLDGGFAWSQGHYKASEFGGTSKLGIGTEGPRYGFGGAGSKESIGDSGGFDTYIVKYIVYDLEGGDSNV